MKRLLTILIVTVVLLPSSFSLAASEYKYTLLESVPFIGSANESVAFPSYITGIYKFAIGTVGLSALLMLVIGGFWYLTSAGNQAWSGNAKSIIKDALLGLIVALFAWVLLNTLNPDLLRFQPTIPGILSIPAGNPPGSVDIPATVPTNLPKGCENYIDDFKDVTRATPEMGCLLYGIASQESGCNPDAKSGAGACGMMQLLPSTAKAFGIDSCQALMNNPEQSIRIAAQFLQKNVKTLSQYSHFSIGSAYTQSEKNVTVGAYSYDAGNDDIIASYNAGAGTVSGSGKKGPFAISSSCKDRNGTIPVWQCDIKTEGFRETRNYVRRVQGFQDLCETKGILTK